MSATKVLCLPLLIFATSGCISWHMRYASPRRSVTASAELSTVVFIRPVLTGVREGLIITVVDGGGEFIGQVNDGDHFIARFTPGRRELVAFFKGKADLVSSDLTAGEVYYIQVTPEPGGLYAQATFSVLHPHDGAQEHAQALLDETRQVVPLVRQAYRELDPEEVRQKIAIARSRWSEYEPDQRQRRTLQPADGLGPLR